MPSCPRPTRTVAPCFFFKNAICADRPPKAGRVLAGKSCISPVKCAFHRGAELCACAVVGMNQRKFRFDEEGIFLPLCQGARFFCSLGRGQVRSCVGYLFGRGRPHRRLPRPACWTNVPALIADRAKIPAIISRCGPGGDAASHTIGFKPIFVPTFLRRTVSYGTTTRPIRLSMA